MIIWIVGWFIVIGFSWAEEEKYDKKMPWWGPLFLFALWPIIVGMTAYELTHKEKT